MSEDYSTTSDTTSDISTDTSDTADTSSSDTVDTSDLPEDTSGSDGSEDLPEDDGSIEEISEATDSNESNESLDDADESSDVSDTTDTECTNISDTKSDTLPKDNKAGDGSEDSRESSDGELNEIPDEEENTAEDEPNEVDDDVEEIPDSVESDDTNDEQSDLEKGTIDNTKNSGTDDSDAFSERKPIDNSEADRNKSYASDDLGNTERERDEAYQELLDYRNANNLGRSMEPSQEEQRLIDKANEASDNYERLKHAQELRDAKFEDVIADFNSNRWNEMSQEQREDAINRLHDFCAEDLRLENQPKITYYNGEKGDYGWSRPGEIGINRNEMWDSAETADTVAHENRHQYQSERAKNPTTSEEREWRENLKPGNYIRPEDDRRGYWNQPVERDARNYAREFKERINGGSVQ